MAAVTLDCPGLSYSPESCCAFCRGSPWGLFGGGVHWAQRLLGFQSCSEASLCLGGLKLRSGILHWHPFVSNPPCGPSYVRPSYSIRNKMTSPVFLKDYFNQKLKDDDCEALAVRAKSVRDQLAKRRQEMIDDKLKLPPAELRTHIIKISELQQHLRDVLNEMDARNCRGPQGPASVPFWSWAAAKDTKDATSLAEKREKERLSAVLPAGTVGRAEGFANTVGLAVGLVLLVLTAPEMLPLALAL